MVSDLFLRRRHGFHLNVKIIYWKVGNKKTKKGNDEKIKWLEQINYAVFFSVDGGISNGP